MHFEGSAKARTEWSVPEMTCAVQDGWGEGVTLLQCILKLPVNDRKRGRSREVFALSHPFVYRLKCI